MTCTEAVTVSDIFVYDDMLLELRSCMSLQTCPPRTLLCQRSGDGGAAAADVGSTVQLANRSRTFQASGQGAISISLSVHSTLQLS